MKIKQTIGILAVLMLLIIPLSIAKNPKEETPTEIFDDECNFVSSETCLLNVPFFEPYRHIYTETGEHWIIIYFGIIPWENPNGVIQEYEGGVIFQGEFQIGDLILDDQTDTGIDIVRVEANNDRMIIGFETD